jgi:hypothetical protein
MPTSIQMNGIYRRSQNGCVGRRTIDIKCDMTVAKKLSISAALPLLLNCLRKVIESKGGGLEAIALAPRNHSAAGPVNVSTENSPRGLAKRPIAHVVQCDALRSVQMWS